MITPEKRAHLASIGRLGGLTYAAQNDVHEAAANARSAFNKSFLTGHGCRVCPRVDIPDELEKHERERRASALRSIHFTRLARRRHAA